MYEPYKANRDAQPEDIGIALPYIRTIVEAFNIPIMEVQGYEADDAIGTISKQAEKEGFTVYMVTPDKDYAQLVSKNIFLYKPARFGNGIDILGEEEVLAKWDIENVLQVIDILGLQGDSVDNIPGIPGIGAKTAVKLLKLYGSVEGIIENVEELKGKQKENVINFTDQGLLSKKLATIDLEVPIKFDAKRYVTEQPDKAKLAEIFKELEFRSLADTILGKSVPTQGDLFGKAAPPRQKATNKDIAANYSVSDFNIGNTKHKYVLVSTDKERKALATKLAKQKIISYDTETTGIDANKAELVGLAFSFKDHEGYYVPVPEDKAEAQAVVDIFKPILENPNIDKIGQNIKYDNLMMKWYEVDVQGKLFDTMIAHYLLEPDLRHKLDFISAALLNYKMVPIEDIIGKRGKNQLTMRDVAVEKVVDYAAEDADITWQVKKILEKDVKKEKLEDLYYKVEEPLIPVLCQMEYEGVRIDGDFLNNYSKVLAKSIAKEEKDIYKQAGVDFNIGSPRQVGEVLFDKLKIPYRWRKTASGQYSTDVEKLNELAPNHEIIQNILEYRKLSKLKSTYVDALPLQNIPIKNEAGREIRKAFIPRDEDHILLAADYSQIE